MEEAKQKSYAELVGEKLRRLRQGRGLSLQEVCERSGGAFVVSTLSAYERGKRSLSLERLVELAEIYGSSPTAILDVQEDAFSLTRSRKLRIRLDRLEKLSEEERRPLENFTDFLKRLRNDPSTDVLTIRKDDLAYLADLYGVGPQVLKSRLEAEGILE